MSPSGELVPGFDSETDETLRLELERMEGVERGIVIRMSGYLDGFNVGFFSKRIEKVLDGVRFLSFVLGNVSYILPAHRDVHGFLKNLRGGEGYLLFGARPISGGVPDAGFLEYSNRTKPRVLVRFRRESRDPGAADFPLRVADRYAARSFPFPRGRAAPAAKAGGHDRSGCVARGAAARPPRSASE